MSKINIVDREMTSVEFERLKSGFDEYTLESGIELQSSERFGFVASNDGHFIGCSSGLAYKSGNEYSGWLYLTDLFVEKEYRFQGLGTKLLVALEQKIVSFGVVNIWTWTAGYEAPEFYKKNGYEMFAEMENWYSDGGSRVGCRKKLKSN